MVVQVCVGETHSSTNCSFAQMVAAERAVMAPTAPDGGLVSCFTFMNAPPTLWPFNQVLGASSRTAEASFVQPNRGGTRRLCCGVMSRYKDEDLLVDVVYDY